MEELFEKTENKQEEGNHKEQTPTKLKTKMFLWKRSKIGNSQKINITDVRKTLFFLWKDFLKITFIFETVKKISVKIYS